MHHKASLAVKKALTDRRDLQHFKESLTTKMHADLSGAGLGAFLANAKEMKNLWYCTLINEFRLRVHKGF